VTPRPPPPDHDLIERRELLDGAGIARTLRRMAHEIVERVAHHVEQAGEPLYLVGVRTGGAFLAHRLSEILVEDGEPKPRLGAVDISLYRDDVFRGLPKPEIGPTDLPEPIEGKTIVLVDDVLYTGRTIRAAMDVLADYGRPRAVKLAALVDRGRRELPIQPDIVGLTMQTTATESVRVMLSERGERDRVVLRERRA
jgi:pyrimidine operon attenuation protein/uracil phosphoribosyltransferase